MPQISPPKPPADPAEEADRNALAAALEVVERVQALRVRPVRSCELLENLTPADCASLGLFTEVDPQRLGRRLARYVNRPERGRMLIKLTRNGSCLWSVVLVRQPTRANNIWDLRMRSVESHLASETNDGLCAVLGAVLAECEKRGLDLNLTEEQ